MRVVEIRNLPFHIKKLEDRKEGLMKRKMKLYSKLMFFIEEGDEKRIEETEERMQVTNVEIEEIALEEVAINKFRECAREEKENILYA